MATTSTPCEHDDQTGARTPDSPVTNAWDCDHCGHLTPFTAEDYEFVNSQPWSPRRPADVNEVAWLFMSRESRRAHYAARVA